MYEHSALTTHSGLQFGGYPTYAGRQEQTAWLLTSLHWLFGPQGEGWQGFVGTGGAEKIDTNSDIDTATRLKIRKATENRVNWSAQFSVLEMGPILKLQLSYTGNHCKFTLLTLLLNESAVFERITSIRRPTRTQRCVINNLTFGITTAHTWARIDAFVIHASFVRWAIAVNYAFWTATFVRISEIFG